MQRTSPMTGFGPYSDIGRTEGAPAGRASSSTSNQNNSGLPQGPADPGPGRLLMRQTACARRSLGRGVSRSSIWSGSSGGVGSYDHVRTPAPSPFLSRWVKWHRSLIVTGNTQIGSPSRAIGCCDFDRYRFAFLLNSYHKCFCELVARITTVVRNARQYMADLACFNYLLTRSFNFEGQLAFKEIRELMTVRMDMTGQCLAGSPIRGEKQYFLPGNAFQVRAKKSARGRTSQLSLNCSRSCNPHNNSCGK